MPSFREVFALIPGRFCSAGLEASGFNLTFKEYAVQRVNFSAAAKGGGKIAPSYQ